MTPRCPFCNTPGIDQIAAQSIGPALLIFCKNCGAIHGVVPAPARKTEVSPKPALETPQQNPGPEPEPFQIKPLEDLEPIKPPAKSDKPLTPQQAFLLQKQMVQKATAYKIFLTGDDPDEEKE